MKIRTVQVFAGVWNGETGNLIEANPNNEFHRVEMHRSKVILAVKPSEYIFVNYSEAPKAKS
jgi:hypothetical protein